VDYELKIGTLPPGERYVWVISGPSGFVNSQTVQPEEIGPRGTLRSSLFIAAPVLMDGRFSCYLAVEPSGLPHGRLKRISNIVALR
jgi:hypothetical protein